MEFAATSFVAERQAKTRDAPHRRADIKGSTMNYRSSRVHNGVDYRRHRSSRENENDSRARVQAFIRNAAQGGHAKIVGSQAAAEKATSTDVKTYTATNGRGP